MVEAAALRAATGLDRKRIRLYINARESMDGYRPPIPIATADEKAARGLLVGNSSTVELRTLTPSI
jgi:hypothetical protein